MVVLYVRSEATADASLAAIFERSKFGIAIAAMIKMIATTISNSINEKPFCRLRMHGAPFKISISIVMEGSGAPPYLEMQHPNCQYRYESCRFGHNTRNPRRFNIYAGWAVLFTAHAVEA